MVQRSFREKAGLMQKWLANGELYLDLSQWPVQYSRNNPSPLTGTHGCLKAA